jgi:hypothetical protein
VALGSTLVFSIGTVVGLVRVFTLGASPLWASAGLYGATVGYGLAEMAKLRERRLFRPGQPPPPHSALVWWALRVLLVTGVATLPAVMMLGGLTAR